MKTEAITGSVIVKLAAIVIIIAGLITAKSIVVPILLAGFITILTSPLLIWLQEKGLNSAFALVGVVVMLIVVMSFLGFLISTSLNDFSTHLPLYEQKLHITIERALSFMHERGLDFPDSPITELINPSRIALFVSGFVKGLGAVLTNGLMILLLVVFMLLEVSILPRKLQTIPVLDASSHAAAFLKSVKQYMMIKGVFSLLTGIVYTLLLIIGLDYALLWGVLAFLLNFVPNIGSIIAAIPAVILALIQLGFLGAFEVAVVFLVVNIVLGSILEPKYMGKGLGLSTLIVFVSLIFWGWAFGPIGMLLSIPLTIMLKLGLQLNPNTKWIAVLLDSDVRR